MVYFFRKAVKNLLHLKIAKSSSYFKDIVFLIKNRKSIKVSISTNRGIGETWL